MSPQDDARTAEPSLADTCLPLSLVAARQCSYLLDAIEDTDADHAAVPFDAEVVGRVIGSIR